MVMVMAVVVATAKTHAHGLSVPNLFPLLLANATAAGAEGQLFPGGWLWSYGQETGALTASIIQHTLN